MSGDLSIVGREDDGNPMDPHNSKAARCIHTRRHTA